MAFTPHTESEIKTMLDAIGVNDMQALFAEVPSNLLLKDELNIPASMNEMQISRLMKDRAALDDPMSCFLGAGAYEHHIPAAVWELVGRGEFYTAYTPYQAEASQGGLQLIYEYQTMIASLTGLDVSNASMYDGATAVSEAVLMAVRSNKKSKSKRVIFTGSVNPHYETVVETIVKHQEVDLTVMPFNAETGCVDFDNLETYAKEGAAALVIQQPNVFGCLEDVDRLTNWAHEHGMLVIAVVNPTSLALLKEPGAWGETGADIACGEGQPLGVPLSSGGPYFGFMTCKEAFVRQMPGRIVGRTIGAGGKEGFALTLQAREQHIRRAKAKSNICTNQGLMVVAATIYMSLLGPEGLKRVALASHRNTKKLIDRLQSIEGAEIVFSTPYFHEFVLRFEKPVADVLAYCQSKGVLAGVSLKKDYPDLGEAMLVCVTETKTDEDIENYAVVLEEAIASAVSIETASA